MCRLPHRTEPQKLHCEISEASRVSLQLNWDPVVWNRWIHCNWNPSRLSPKNKLLTPKHKVRPICILPSIFPRKFFELNRSAFRCELEWSTGCLDNLNPTSRLPSALILIHPLVAQPATPSIDTDAPWTSTHVVIVLYAQWLNRSTEANCPISGKQETLIDSTEASCHCDKKKAQLCVQAVKPLVSAATGNNFRKFKNWLRLSNWMGWIAHPDWGS